MLRAVTSSGAFSRTGSSSSSAGPRATQTNGQATSFPTNVSRSSSSSSMQDWRVYLTIEERQAVRSKIRDAYKNRCTTFEELLHAVCYLIIYLYCTAVIILYNTILSYSILCFTRLLR
jgi:hypothetical protein